MYLTTGRLLFVRKQSEIVDTHDHIACLNRSRNLQSRLQAKSNDVVVSDDVVESDDVVVMVVVAAIWSRVRLRSGGQIGVRIWFDLDQNGMGLVLSTTLESFTITTWIVNVVDTLDIKKVVNWIL